MFPSIPPKHCLLIAIILCLHLAASAQLRADFSLDKSGGCSPLAVSFTNSSTGTSATTTYEWDFGNGNSSALKNPGAIFREEKQYTVTLTVKDGGQVATKTQTVTVYKKPVVDFSASLEKGCAPLPVTFTSNSTAGDGTISNYFWDFGDGFTQSTTNNQIAHSYLFEQKPAVTLTVSNSYGCANTKKLNDAAEILPGVTASFEADKTFLCQVTDPVKMINKSSGTGDLSYEWDFGDGNKSSEINPTYSFNKKGTYAVQLVVKSSLGCLDTLKKNGYLNVADFKSDFSIPTLTCVGGTYTFLNLSTPVPTSSTWEVDDHPVPSSGTTLNYSFVTAGLHTVKLRNTFGDCAEVITKSVAVQDVPTSAGFLFTQKNICGAPTDIEFKDTTFDATQWQWNFDYDNNRNFHSNEKSPTYRFDQNRRYFVHLKVTNTPGCTKDIYKYVDIKNPSLNIYYKNSSSNSNSSCGPLTVTVFANTSLVLKDYLWKFSDGETSTEAEPQHTFKNPGTYYVTLNYTTSDGCKGSADFSSFRVSERQKIDLTVNSNTICGSTPVNFMGKYPIIPTETIYWDWRFGDNEPSFSWGQNVSHVYKEPGTYSVEVVAWTGVCSDTVRKKDFITVTGPFPSITSITNTCDGTRGEVIIKQDTRYATGGVWDFGDGTTMPFDPSQPEIKHVYTKSGAFLVTLTATAGMCSVSASKYASVLIRQVPKLTLGKTIICPDDKVSILINNYDRNVRVSDIITPNYSFRLQYEDGADFTGTVTTPYYWGNEYEGSITGFTKGKSQIRVITTSSWFGCNDTSIYIPITIRGSAAGFEVLNNNTCFKNAIILKDTSKGYEAPIQSWQWNFGDGQVQTFNQSTSLSHVYANPGQYNVTLKVTDASGCSSTTSSSAHLITVNGPKAGFSSSGTNVPLNTNVQFYNNTNNYNSSATQYQWDFGDGAISNSYSPSHLYDKAGDYTVRLIAKNETTGCADTAIQKISVKNLNVNFSFAKSFLSNSKCPPVLVQFTNLSSNHTGVTWDFGDGTKAQNIDRPTHVYTQPGKYIIRLVITNENGLSSTHTDSIIIEQPTVNVTADMLRSCTAQSVTISAIPENASSYLWDFGDGTMKQATDTFSTHYYSKAGSYTPHLIAKDANGCPASVTLTDKIVIDSLNISLTNLPQKICSPKEVAFTPSITSIAADQAQQDLIYHWDFGTGAAKDTANIKMPSFTYQQPGTYTVSLKVESLSGCVKETKATITAYQGLGGHINGPAEICEGLGAQFSGATALPGQPQWKWIFDDGSVVEKQTPSLRTYNNAGTFPIKLIVDNNGCADTITHSLIVRGKPTVNLSSKQAVVCEGSGVSITSAGGTSYTWSPSTALNDINNATIVASPVVNTTYTVSVTNAYGCTNKDSVNIVVAHPFKVNLASDAAVCKGSSIELKPLGAASYQWIGNTSGLSNTAAANPVATPAETSMYTVVGTDKDKCFTDTAFVKVTVNPTPSVDAGQSVEILMGSPHQLQATASSDVKTWEWSPSKYLSCTNCQAPEARPVEPMNYKLTVTNNFGCTAVDTVSIKLFCSESRIYIPNTFTPNNDGKNDRFAIKGQGVRIVKYLGIYNRWGELVFERKNFEVDDQQGAWDGRFKGVLVPVGSYVYFTEMSCNEKTFTQKGTVTVVY